MRVAVQYPQFLRRNQARNFDGYNFEFVRQFRPLIYLPFWRHRISRASRWRKDLLQNGLDPDDFEFIYTVEELNRRADVLVCFNQAACLSGNQPPKNFNGLKIWHVMDFNFRAAECYELLRERGVEFVMAYTRLDRYCGFFRRFYPGYIEKVISVPFGFGKRFQNQTVFAERILKVLAMGAINPVNQDLASGDQVLREYCEFYREFPFSQMWRHKLAKNQDALSDLLESYLPVYPQISRPTDDPVTLLNRYALFANDESICEFPPARTYEGTACGAAMVSSDHECFKELGFKDGINCIMHHRQDLESFREKVKYYLARPVELAAIAQRGCEMVRARYTHEAVAQKLHADILSRWAR